MVSPFGQRILAGLIPRLFQRLVRETTSRGLVLLEVLWARLPKRDELRAQEERAAAPGQLVRRDFLRLDLVVPVRARRLVLLGSLGQTNVLGEVFGSHLYLFSICLLTL